MFPTFFFSVLRPLTKPYAGRRSSLGASTHHCQWRLNLCFTMCSSLFPGCSRHDPIQAVVNVFGGWNLQWSYVGRENMTLSLSLESCFNSTMGKLANRRERACKVRKSCHVFHQDPPPPPSQYLPCYLTLFWAVLGTQRWQQNLKFSAVAPGSNCVFNPSAFVAQPCMALVISRFGFVLKKHIY